MVEKFDILGATVETILLSHGATLPFAGWAIGTIVKNAIPTVWEKISQYRPVIEAESLLNGVIKNDPNAVRLHRVRKNITRNFK